MHLIYLHAVRANRSVVQGAPSPDPRPWGLTLSRRDESYPPRSTDGRKWMVGTLWLRNGTGTLLCLHSQRCIHVHDETAQMSLLWRRGQSPPSSALSPESFKNKILYGLSYLEVTTPVGGERASKKKKGNRQRSECLPLFLSHVSVAVMQREHSEWRNQQFLRHRGLGYRLHSQQQRCFFSCSTFPQCLMCFAENSVWCLKINLCIKTKTKKNWGHF